MQKNDNFSEQNIDKICTTTISVDFTRIQEYKNTRIQEYLYHYTLIFQNMQLTVS